MNTKTTRPRRRRRIRTAVLLFAMPTLVLLMAPMCTDTTLDELSGTTRYSMIEQEMRERGMESVRQHFEGHQFCHKNPTNAICASMWAKAVGYNPTAEWRARRAEWRDQIAERRDRMRVGPR